MTFSSARPNPSSTRRSHALLVLAIASLLATSVACSNDGGSDDSSGSTSTATSSGSGSSGSGGGSTPSPGGSANQLSTHAYAMQFLPSASGEVDGYQVSMGPSSGSYDEVVDIPLSSISQGGNVWTYDLTLEADRDYYIVLRAYNAFGMSGNSNEIKVDAVSSPALSGPSGSNVQTASANHLASLGSTSIDRTSAATAEVASDAQLADAGSDATRGETGDAQELQRDELAMTSLDFDGEREFVASSAPLPLGTDYAFSVSIWARPVVDGAARRTLVDVGEAATDANRLTVAVVNGADVEVALHGADGSELYRASFAGVVLDQEWHHVALVFDAATDAAPTFFLDAEHQTPTTHATATGAWEMTDSARRVVLGGSASQPGEPWLGQIGHAAVFAAALSDAEIAELSMLGHAADLRSPGAEYAGQAHLAHYWRLGGETAGLGFDLGNAVTPIDFDDQGGSIDETDVSDEAPVVLTAQAI